MFGYLDYEAEKVTDRGRWLADLHIDRPLLVGEALESGLFNSLEPKQLAGIIAALTADEDRDYGELELDDDVVTSLARFEEIGFKVSAEEWKHGLDPAPELNFSAAGAAVRWAGGAEWSRNRARNSRRRRRSVSHVFANGRSAIADCRFASQSSGSRTNGCGGRRDGFARADSVGWRPSRNTKLHQRRENF